MWALEGRLRNALSEPTSLAGTEGVLELEKQQILEKMDKIRNSRNAIKRNAITSSCLILEKFLFDSMIQNIRKCLEVFKQPTCIKVKEKLELLS